MLLHHLRATAFGPFGDTIEIDFDDLGQAGLFLFTGPTGAGKTSVLDAVCFGLYGVVPGERESAKHVRSDHAAPGVAPEVVLEIGVADRRFRFTRSPRWDRPKQRGTGLRTIQASALLQEHVDGAWVTRSTRIDETGHFVDQLLGMTATQFTQVALLPQGEFQTFLRASSAERHAVLQRLFRTDRFHAVEAWLVARRQSLRRACQTLQEEAAAVVNRILEVAEVQLPEETDPHDLSVLVRTDEAAAWTDTIRSEAATASAEAQARCRETESRLGTLEADHRRLRERHRAQVRAEGAEHILEELTSTEADSRRDQDRLHDSQRAGEVVAHAERARDLRSRRDTEHDRLDALLVASARLWAELPDPIRATVTVGPWAPSSCGPSPQEPDSDFVERAHSELTAALARTQDWASCESRLEELAQALPRLDGDLVAAVQQHARLLEERAGFPAIREALVLEIDHATALLQRRPLDERDHAAATQGHAAALEWQTLEPQLSARYQDVREAVDAVQVRRTEMLDLKEARILGMAGELALALAAGASCPVCGSCEHPSPAAGGSPSLREDEDAAQTRLDDAQIELQTMREALSMVQIRRDRAWEDSAGRPIEDWAEAVEVSARALQESADAGLSLERARAALEDHDRLTRESDEAVTGLSHLVTTQRAEAERLTQEQNTLRREREALLGTTASPLTELISHQQRVLSTLEEVRTALRALSVLRATVDETEAGAAAAATRAGFPDLDTALAAVLDEAEARELTAALEARQRRRIEAETTLTDPEVVGARSEPAVGADVLVELQAACESAKRTHQESLSQRDHAHKVNTRVVELSARFTAITQKWRPVLADFEVAASLSSFAEGTSSDNQLRMRLSAFVLAERLRQVVAAANEHLGHMTEQRYLLEQSDARAAGDRRGGLSLWVRDQWTDVLRDPATLSGGETFVVSLALALGLADTVTHEAGGTRIESLFIDEGFGSLDTETLDAVMDTLDRLRGGGRVVGIISHVTELRDRIPRQVHVSKGRRGSTVSALS